MKKFVSAAVSILIAASIITPAFAASSASAKPRVDGACMATAVTKRDTAVAAALQIVVTAVQTRGTALAAAWTAMDKTAVKAANDAFKGAWKTFDTTRKAAWTQFKIDAKVCKPPKGTTIDQPSGQAGL